MLASVLCMEYGPRTGILPLQDEAEADALRPTEEGMQGLRGDGNGAEARGENYDEVADIEDEGNESLLQQVWVLCGGSGSEADASLASGLHVYHELLKQSDVLVSAPVRSASMTRAPCKQVWSQLRPFPICLCKTISTPSSAQHSSAEALCTQ